MIFWDDILSNILMGILTLIIVALLGGCVFLVVCEIKRPAYEDKLWNNGHCVECNDGDYQFIQAVGHKYDSSYIYACDNCGYRIEMESLK